MGAHRRSSKFCGGRPIRRIRWNPISDVARSHFRLSNMQLCDLAEDTQHLVSGSNSLLKSPWI